MAAAAANRFPVHVTSVRRSRAEQQALYDRFLRGESDYPVAPPGQSLHEFGLAFDVGDDNGDNPSDYLAAMGQVWNSWGGFWSPRDQVHFALYG